MKTDAQPFSKSLGRNRSAPSFLTGFQSIAPRYRSAQDDLLSWLVDSHARTGSVERHVMEPLFARYSAASEQIAYRSHELADFTHRRWDEMRLFGPQGSDLGKKTRFFEERVQEIFERLYPAQAKPPRSLVHVTCTGYVAPSGAQKLVSSRQWGQQTEVIHAYHMGCYAAHPAIRMAAGLRGPVDIVHTELCSLHLDPTSHDPAQLVIQSLFADGFIKYRLVGDCPQAGLEILAARDQIVPNSADLMTWSTGPMNFTMTLSKEVPTLLASALPRFAESLFEEADLDWNREKSKAIFAIHPGGPRIIELSKRILGLEPHQVQWSRHILREHGNMSSATLPHIWQEILADRSLPDGTLVVSLGAGPGLTLSGLLFRKRG